MKKFLLLLSFITLFFSAFSQIIWTVSSVPNTRLQSNDIHVSDPDGYLSDSVEMQINTALCAIRDKADVFVVTLNSIGSSDPKHFATALFNEWGIGDAATDNGVLLLFVEDQHALEFETGYGAEATLTDAQCQRIFTKKIVPFFKAGDYEGGLVSGVAEIVTVYGGEIPMGLKTTLPKADDESSGESNPLDEYSVVFIFFALLLFVLPLLGVIFWIVKRKTKMPVPDKFSSTEEQGVTYIDGFKTSWSGSPWDGKGCLGGLMIGMSPFMLLFVVAMVVIVAFPNLEENRRFELNAIGTLILYLTWICFRHNHRVLKEAQKLSASSINPKSVYEAASNHTANKVAMWMAPWLGWVYNRIYKKKIEQSNECCCPVCGDAMKKDGTFRLPENHLAEDKAGALRFTAYRCARDHAIVVKERGKQYSQFTTCPQCGAYTLKYIKTETLKEATYSSSGEERKTYICQHCGHTILKSVVIPKKVYYSSDSSSSGSSSSRSYSSHSSSRSSGGSFGGGRSGGGGYSGRW